MKGNAEKFAGRLHVAVFVLAVVAGAFVCEPAFGQAYPGKPVRMIVPGPAGGTVDTTARLLAEGLKKDLDIAVIVDPHPGGAGAIAINELLAAPSDGHTVLVGPNSLVSEIPHIVKLKMDAAKAMRLFYAHPDLDFHSLETTFLDPRKRVIQYPREPQHRGQPSRLAPHEARWDGELVDLIAALAQHPLEPPGPRQHEPRRPAGAHALHHLEQTALAAVQLGLGVEEQDPLWRAALLHHAGSRAAGSVRPFSGA